MIGFSLLPVPACLLALAFSPSAQAQTAPSRSAKPSESRALTRTRELLRARPTHAALFDRYFKLLVSGNSLGTETDAFAARVKKDQTDSSAAIILGRLLLRSGKEERALEVLEAIEDESPEIKKVLGEIFFKLARFDASVRAFRAALPGAHTSESKRVLFEKLGKAQLALGRKQDAVVTWRRIAALDGGKFHRRLRVAELLVEAGLLEEGAKEYQPLLLETADDPARACRVLRDLGRLRELQGDLPAALKTYDEVLAKTSRGNWLRKEVERRIVQIHRRTGKLDDLVARLQEQVQAKPADLAASELLADVLTEMRKLAQACTVLARVAKLYPRDVRLARRLAELYLEQKKPGKAIAEYQRILSERPEEFDLYLELGTLFAKNDRFKEAKNQWEKALARNLNDASLCARMASMYALWHRRKDAIRLYERAIEIEPASMVRYVDLAEFRFAGGERDAAIAVLDRALVRAKGKPRRLEALVAPLREHELFDRARGCLQRVLAAEPDNEEIRYSLADLLLNLGRQDEARPLLWRVVEQDRTAWRTMAANTLVNLASRTNAAGELIAQASKRSSAGAALVLGRLHTQARDFERAIEDFQRALKIRPEDVVVRRLLARLLAEEGDYRGALAQYRKIALTAPGEARRNFSEVARLHLDLYDLDGAIEVWRKAMRDNPDNASVFVSVGKELLSVQRVPEALEAFGHAARLKPTDPDVQLRFADALRQAGKSEEAKKHLLSVANGALDARDREQARARLFELLGEQGEIDTEMARLQNATAENPYDLEAPQLLADLYLRTGDYVLGLQMVERAVKFQPRSKDLLTRRAELLEALEEWDEAFAAHKELLKFPDADRDLHLAGMGKALYESGRAVEAKKIFRKIRDRGRVAKLYERYHLHEEAIEFYEAAIARRPADVRSSVALAVELEKIGKIEDAIKVLERALNLRPYYRRALATLGKLYVRAGRRSDAVAVGMRLFGLRGEQVKKTRREEQAEEKTRRGSGYRRTARRRSFGARRLAAAQSYFQSRGLDAEWGKILVAESKRRPTDLVLYNAVKSHYSWREKSAREFVRFARSILKTDQRRVPPGYTKRSYRQMVEADIVRTWSKDAAVAQARLAELDGPEPTRLELLERAMLHRALGKLDDMEVDLKAVLKIVPTDPVALTLLAERNSQEKRYGEAIPLLRRLAAWWPGPGAKWQDELAARRLASFKKRRKSLLDELPRRVRRRVEDRDLRAVLARLRYESFSELGVFSFPEVVPSRPAILNKILRLYHAAGDESGMDLAVKEAVAAAKTFAEKAHLGQVLFQEGRKDAALALLSQVEESARRVQSDPVQVYFWNHFKSVMGSAASALGELLAKRGQIVQAYHVLRENGRGEQAERILRTSGKAEEILALLERQAEESAARLRKARKASVGELRNLELDYRDALIKLADYHMSEKDFGQAESLYRGSLELLPDDLDVRLAIASLCMRRGAADEAIAMHEEIISLKRRLRRAAAGDTAVPPTRLRPTYPGASPNSSVRSYSPYSYYARRTKFDVGSSYQRILSIQAGRNNHEGVLDTLRRIMREDPVVARRMSWSMLNTLRNQDLGKKKLPILRLLKGLVKGNDWLTLEYAKACREEGDLAQAKRTLEVFLNRKVTSNDYYATQAEKELEKVRQKLGENRISLADLRAKVKDEPENVRHRMRLARRLKKDKHYGECLAEAQVIVEKAPYLTKAKDLVVEAAAAAGRDEIAIAMLHRLFEESSGSNDKIRRGVNLANWLYAKGDEKEACKIIDGLEIQSGGSNNFSPGNWFLDKNRRGEALRQYRLELERSKAQSWRVQTLRSRIARLEMAGGDEVAAIRRLLAAISKAGSLAERESRWRDLLATVKRHPEPKKLAAILEPVFDKLDDTEDLLVRAALSFARGDVKGAESLMEKAVAGSSKEVYLFPLLLGLRKLAGDPEGALTVLDEMSRVYGGSESMRWNQGITLSERDQVKVERARILEKMGKQKQAEDLILSLLDETEPETFKKVSNIYSLLKDYENALAWFRRYVQKLGTRSKANLLAEANLLIKCKRDREALPLAQKAYVMARGDSNTRRLLIKLHRRAGTLGAFVTELEKDLAKDFRDAGLRGSLINLYRELRRTPEIARIYEKMRKEEDLRIQGLDGLIALAEKDHDQARKITFLRELLPLRGGEQKKALYRRIAEAQAETGDMAAAERSYRDSLDLETAAGWWLLGQWLDGKDRSAKALLAYRKVRELDPDHRQVLYPLAKAAWRGHQHTLAIKILLLHLRKNRGSSSLFNPEQRTILLDSLAGLDAAERKKLLTGGSDAESEEQAALLCAVSARPEQALRLARAALATDSGLFEARAVRVQVLDELDRTKELFDAVVELRRRVEREYVITSDYGLYNRAVNLQNRLGRIAHVLGDDELAQREWRAPPVRRTPNSNPFGFWRSDWQVRYLAERWMGVRRPKKALAALRDEFLLRESAPFGIWVKALEKVGKVAQVERFAWQRLLDPLGLYGIQTGSYGWIWEGGTYRRANGMQEFLVGLYRRTGRLAELRARAEKLLAQPSTKRQAEGLLDALARLTGDHLRLAQKQADALKDKEPSRAEYWNLAQAWAKAGKPAKALAVMHELLDFESPALRVAVTDLRGRGGYSYRISSSTGTNPFSFTFNGASSGSIWGWSSNRSTREYRIAAAALLFLTGDRAKAREVEADLLQAKSKKARMAAARAIAYGYARAGAHTEAARIWRSVLQSKDFNLKEAERSSMLASLAGELHLAGDEQGARAVRVLERESLNEQIAKAPGPHALALRERLASLFLSEPLDLAGCAEQFTYLSRFLRRSTTLAALHARLLYLQGKAGQAVRAYRALSERHARDGQQEDPLIEQAGLGLALLASGDRQTGMRILTQARFRLDSKSPLRAEIEKALEESTR